MDVERCLQLGVRAGIPLPGTKWKPIKGVELDEPPATIKDQLSAVLLGSGFHAGDRFSGSKQHCDLKAFHVALS